MPQGFTLKHREVRSYLGMQRKSQERTRLGKILAEIYLQLLSLHYSAPWCSYTNHCFYIKKARQLFWLTYSYYLFHSSCSYRYNLRASIYSLVRSKGRVYRCLRGPCLSPWGQVKRADAGGVAGKGGVVGADELKRPTLGTLDLWEVVTEESGKRDVVQDRELLCGVEGEAECEWDGKRARRMTWFIKGEE